MNNKKKLSNIIKEDDIRPTHRFNRNRLEDAVIFCIGLLFGIFVEGILQRLFECYFN